MTAADWIDNLARLAKAAQELTPGEWVAGDGWVYTRPVYDDDNRLASVLGMKYTDWDRAAQEAERAQRNAKFIAAANPTTTLRLIEAARRAEDYNAEAERHAVRVVALEVQNEDLTADRDALAARMPCDGGCNYGDGPVEDCSRHGRPPAEVWQIVTEVQAQRDELAARLAAVEAAFENLPIFLSAIEKDQRRTPEGRGGEAHFIPATPGHGKSGCPGDNITRWLNEVRAALSAASTDTTKETP